MLFFNLQVMFRYHFVLGHFLTNVNEICGASLLTSILKRGGYKRWTNDGQLMDNPWINASSREFTVSSIGCAYRAELILGR